MRVVSLGSGSSGNALLVEAGPKGRTRLLIDAGLSLRMLNQRLYTLNVELSQITAVLLTHEHSDHVLSLPYLLKRSSCSVVADPLTLNAVEAGIRAGYWRSDSGRLVNARREMSAGETPVQNVETVAVQTQALEEKIVLPSKDISYSFPAQPFVVGDCCTIGDIKVTSFPVSHDAAAPCGYLLEAGGCRICLITDSGEVTPTMLHTMKKADLLIIESNHDYDKLMRGPYPWSLKRRIMSPTGHLSNQQAAAAIAQIYHESAIRWLWLAHLSRTNNTPVLAVEHMRSYLQAVGHSLSQLEVMALPPAQGPVWDSTRLWI